MWQNGPHSNSGGQGAMGDGWTLQGAFAAGVMALALAAPLPAWADDVPQAPALAAQAHAPAPQALPQALPQAQAALPQGRDFAGFIAGVKAEAASKGMAPATLAVLDGVQPIDRIIALDRKQPEFTLTFAQYLGHILSGGKIADGRRMLAENRKLLAALEKRYGVQPRFVVALWGIESDFGRVMGNYSVVAALATLAWDGRRSAYFRGELLDALAILDRGDVRPPAMVGSWAGAMGQCQFMPSTFLKYAQDFDGDGRRDVWGDRADVLASAANYLAGLGWKGNETWGRAVRLPRHFDSHLLGLDTAKPLEQWSRLGVKSADGKALPRRRDLRASLILAEGDHGPAFLVYDNFRAVMKWNRSTFFALAAGQLADRIGRR